MRILMVSGGFPPKIGGVENYVYNLSRALAQRGHHVTVITYAERNASMIQRIDRRLRMEGVQVHRLNTIPTGLQRRHINSHYTRFAPSLVSRLIKEDADIVDSHSYPALHTDLAFKASRKTSTPCVIHVHGMHHVHHLHHFLAGSRELREVEGLIVNNLMQRTLVISYGALPKRVRVIPPGIDYQRFVKARRVNIRKTNKNILFMGRVVESKGLGLLVDAAVDVLHRHPDAQFRIVGEDLGYMRDAKRRAARRGILKNFHFLGAKSGDEVVEEYANCRLLTLPSRHEGFGMVVLESFASGRPAAITDFEGSHWFTQSGGCLVSPRDNSQELANNIIRILQGDELANNMGQRGIKFAAGFDWDQIALKHEKAYRQTISLERG